MAGRTASATVCVLGAALGPLGEPLHDTGTDAPDPTLAAMRDGTTRTGAEFG
jgi:hypothetical protein